MKILITGCNGQVGNSLVKLLSSMLTVEFLAVDHKQLDITDGPAVIKLVNEFKPDVIVNAAAYTSVDKAEQEIELSYAINRDGPLFLAQASNMVCASLIHISTDYVFDGNKNGEYEELDVPRARSVYGASKLAGEEAVIKECNRAVVIRTSWVFSEFGNNFVKTMLALSKRQNSIMVVDDQIGGPTYAGDLANEIVKISELIYLNKNFPFGIYHYSGFPYVTWYEFADTIFDIAAVYQIIQEKPSLNPIKTNLYPAVAKRPKNSCLSMDKIENTLSIRPSNWKVGLERVLLNLRVPNESNRN
ncbi:dTDP-4-dehydrorhamnose reductase [Shewanella mangrovisoli]|uniref:dTDP-4-dehydrorhamnose reductase n=1 Tax=Shewanella mangrovisoli TaxID=2864211 RepID=A0ABV4VFZ9_9GAMM